MAKVSAADVARKPTAGCLVQGRWTLADGTSVAGQAVRFEPRRGGMWRGMAIGRDPLTVQTDAEGRFAIGLAPSSAVGTYTVRMGKLVLAVDVPEAIEAEFGAIVL